MSNATRRIPFHDSMTLDKRAEDFAFLRKNCLSYEGNGLYPGKGFSTMGFTVPTGYVVRYLDLDTEDDDGTVLDGFAVIEDPTNDVVRMLRSRDGNLIREETSGIFRAATRDDDGYLHVLVEKSGTERLYVVYSGTFSSDEGAISASSFEGVLGKFDGLHLYWTENSTGSTIHRSNPQSTTFTSVFTDVGINPDEFDFYNDQMVLFGQDGNKKDTYILFWDKSDNTFFDKRITERNARFIGGGVVDGKLMLVKFVGNSTNLKEMGGSLEVCLYDGEKFVTVNSVKVSGNTVRRAQRKRTQSIGNGVMVVCITGNEDDHSDLYENWVLKIHSDGRIETLWSATGLSAMVPHVGFDSIAFVESNLDFTSAYANLTQVPRSNLDSDNAYSAYANFDDTVYITNFLNNAFNRHTLDAVILVFEKIFEDTDDSGDPTTGERCDVYYRVSERDDFTLLDTITPEKVAEQVNLNQDKSSELTDNTVGLSQQRFDITQMSDGSPLPDFNEIQFKFVPKRGFSIIDAIYSYSYISRTTND